MAAGRRAHTCSNSNVCRFWLTVFNLLEIALGCFDQAADQAQSLTEDLRGPCRSCAQVEEVRGEEEEEEGE